MSDWREQEATNETIFREMNEWTEEANDARLGMDRPIDVYLCECSDRRCTEPIRLTRREYEAVRAVPVRFAIALDHENPEIDRVISENERFATVEKFYGAGAKIARATNPRSTDASGYSTRSKPGVPEPGWRVEPRPHQEVATMATQEESRSPGSDRRLDIRVRASPEEVSEVRVTLGSLGLPVGMLADARLLVTEFLSNSIRHSGLRPEEYVRITADWSGRTLLVTVHDRSRSSPPSPLAGSIRPSPGAESGWGLYLVDRIASRWGTILSEGGGYWFELELQGEPEGS